MRKDKIYELDAVIKKVPDIDGAYIEFPYDVREEFGNDGVIKSFRTGTTKKNRVRNVSISRPVLFLLPPGYFLRFHRLPRVRGLL